MMGRGVQPEVTRSHYGGQEVELCTTTCGFCPSGSAAVSGGHSRLSCCPASPEEAAVVRVTRGT